MSQRLKSPSMERALFGIALVIVIFSAGFYFSEPAITGKVVKVWKNG